MNHLRILKYMLCMGTILNGCAFNFELTSQKTALENQVMGSYKELDDEVLLMASVRGVGTDGKKKEARVVSSDATIAAQAKQNQEFNRDDVDDLKTKQIIGETKDGGISLLPKGVGRVDAASGEELSFAKYIVNQENHDRDVVVKRIVASHQDLTQRDLQEARKVYRQSILENSPVGTWIESETGAWTAKVAKESE
jgi:hypothetical protein